MSRKRRETEIMRLLDVIENTTKYFAKNGVESPRLTIELLLAEVLRKTRMQLYLDFEQDLPESTLAKLRPLVKRRADGEPIDYIFGHKTFDGHKFILTPDVLIPRPETELLLQTIVPLVVADGGPLVDVGAGSGVLATSLARRFPKVAVTGLDISPAALEIARANAKDVPNVTFGESDLLDAFQGSAQGIVANLPYIPTGVMPTLPREVLREPALALEGGVSGTEIIARLIQQAAGRAEWLALEYGDGQTETIKALALPHGWQADLVVKDLTQRERIIVLRKK